MASPFLGQLALVPYNFAPVDWYLCQGQLLPISVNTALFSLINTYFGGNGTSNFALPNLMGRVPVGAGSPPGLDFTDLGQEGGEESVTLNANNVPPHGHQVLTGVIGRGQNAVSSPANAFFATAAANTYASPSNVNHNLAGSALAAANGGNQPHDNRMPYLVLNWIICNKGIFPSRS